MKIAIGVDKYGNILPTREEKEVNLTKYEEDFYEVLLGEISKSVDVDKITLVKNSDSYTSVCYGEGAATDFLRFKLTNRTKWVSISMSQRDKKVNKDNPFFAAQKNKNQRHWKAQLVNIDDFVPYMDLIINSINEIISWYAGKTGAQED